MKYLLNVTENYRVNSEEEAAKLIEEAKKEPGYILTKSSTQYKERKQKGEVIDYWWKVSLTKNFNNEKEPEAQIEVEYKEGSAF